MNNQQKASFKREHKKRTMKKEEFEKEALKTRIALDFPIALAKSVIVLRGSDDEEITVGGLHIPESSDDLKMRGRVMAVGPDVNMEFVDHNGVKRGLRPMDRILFNSYANLNIMHKSNSYVVLSELDVYAVLPEKTKMVTEKLPSRKGKKVNWEG